MYSYLLTVKTESRYVQPWITVEREMKRYFDGDVNYVTLCELDGESVVMVQYGIKLDDILNQWFMADMEGDAPFPRGSLLFWRPLEKGEFLKVTLGVGGSLS